MRLSISPNPEKSRNPKVGATGSRSDVHGFLRRAASANYRTQNNPGAGTLYRISSGANGEALTWRGQAVHIGLFGR